MKKRMLFIPLGCVVVFLAVFATIKIYNIVQFKTNPTLSYIGHASVKLKSKNGKVVYIDPYYSSNTLYEEPADFILVTHEHDDHNKIKRCKQNDDCKVFRYYDMLQDGVYKSFDFGDIKVQAVPSGGNKNHKLEKNVGYIVTIDGVNVYHAGDTSMHEKMDLIVNKNINYAMYPVDGIYTMGFEEATKMADTVGAKHNIPMHGNDNDFIAFNAKNKLLLKNGQTIYLKK